MKVLETLHDESAGQSRNSVEESVRTSSYPASIDPAGAVVIRERALHQFSCRFAVGMQHSSTLRNTSTGQQVSSVGRVMLKPERFAEMRTYKPDYLCIRKLSAMLRIRSKKCPSCSLIIYSVSHADMLHYRRCQI